MGAPNFIPSGEIPGFSAGFDYTRDFAGLLVLAAE